MSDSDVLPRMAWDGLDGNRVSSAALAPGEHRLLIYGAASTAFACLLCF